MSLYRFKKKVWKSGRLYHSGEKHDLEDSVADGLGDEYIEPCSAPKGKKSAKKVADKQVKGSEDK